MPARPEGPQDRPAGGPGDGLPDHSAGGSDQPSDEPTDHGLDGTGGADPHTPDGSPADAWAAIVRQLRDIDVPGAPGAGAEPGVPGRVVRPARSGDEAADGTTPDGTDPAGRALTGRDWAGADAIDAAEAAVDAEEHFRAPDPGPILGGDPLLTMAWSVVVAVPLFYLVVLIAWQSAPRVVLQVAGALLVAGLAVLVWRMPHRRDGSDEDSGAVV